MQGGKSRTKGVKPQIKGCNPPRQRWDPPVEGAAPGGVPAPYQEVGAGAPFPAPVLLPAGFGHHLLAGDGGDEADAREPLAGQETRLEQGPPGSAAPAARGGLGAERGDEPPSFGP